jgi:hypothetical protein
MFGTVAERFRRGRYRGGQSSSLEMQLHRFFIEVFCLTRLDRDCPLRAFAQTVSEAVTKVVTQQSRLAIDYL